jgi:hypothetical protein
MTTKTISADEIEAAAVRTKVQDNGRPDDPGWRYVWSGDLIETLIADGLFKEVPVCELHCEARFAREGGPGIDIDLTEHELPELSRCLNEAH